jgi:HEAT repeat protein
MAAAPASESSGSTSYRDLAAPCDSTRLRTILEIGKLEPDNTAQHSAVEKATADGDVHVRLGAVRALSTLEPAALAKHSAALVRSLIDSDSDVRLAGARALGSLEPPAIAKHASALVALIADTDPDVRLATVLSLGRLKPWKLEQLAQHEIAAHLTHAEAGVRYSALEALGELRATALAEMCVTIVSMLRDPDGDNRLLACQLLCKLKPTSIEAHAAEVVVCLEDDDQDVRLTAMRVLSRLEPSALVQHAADVVQKLVVQTLRGEHAQELGGDTVGGRATRGPKVDPSASLAALSLS